MLHCGLGQEPFHEGIDQRTGRGETGDIGFLLSEVTIDEQDLKHAGDADKIRDIGFSHGAPNGPKPAPHRQIFVTKSESYSFHSAKFP